MATGRPSSYTPELAERICLRIAGGESLADITRDDGMPCYATVTLWRRTNPIFSALYAQAREDQADHEFDEIKALADANPATVPVYDSNGNPVEIKIDTAFEAWRKTRIDARKFRAAKMRPRVYGDKLEIDATVRSGDAIVERLARARDGTAAE